MLPCVRGIRLKDYEMTTKPQPSVGRLGLSMAQYIELCDTFRDKAQTAHDTARIWQNRALLAESRLAALRTAYEPTSTPKEN